MTPENYAFAESAAFTRSGVNGTRRIRRPVASKIALPIAAADSGGRNRWSAEVRRRPTAARMRPPKGLPGRLYIIFI